MKQTKLQREQTGPLQECVLYLLGFLIISFFHSLLVNIFYSLFLSIKANICRWHTQRLIPTFVQIVELIFINNLLHQ